MSISKLKVQHGGTLTPGLQPESQQAKDLAKAKTFATNHTTSSKATATNYRINFHHGSIVPAYERPNFRI